LCNLTYQYPSAPHDMIRRESFLFHTTVKTALLPCWNICNHTLRTKKGKHHTLTQAHTQASVVLLFSGVYEPIEPVLCLNTVWRLYVCTIDS